MNRFLPLTLLVAAACTRFPGRPPADSEAVRPDAVTARRCPRSLEKPAEC